jgi:hypothetical protein
MNERPLRIDPLPDLPEPRDAAATPRQLANTPGSGAPVQLAPQAILDRLGAVALKLTKAANRLDHIAFRSGLKPEMEKPAPGGAPPKQTHFFPALDAMVRALEPTADKIDEATTKLNDLF